MSRIASTLPLKRLYAQDAPERPEPEFTEPSMKRIAESLRSHPDVNRLLNQLWRKDPYTYYHSHRVANHAQLIAAGLHLGNQERIEVYLSGLLHDLGKVLTPDYVLKKPGPLTPDEFAIIRQHPVDSGNLVSKIGDIAYLVEAIRGHHERIDGRGYPDERAGDKIPLFSRIILVADTFDAMTTNRVYRKKVNLERTYDELIRCSGTQFDPEAVKAFIDAHQQQEVQANTPPIRKAA